MKKFILLIGIIASFEVEAGGTVGNGGNEIALDFIRTAQRVLQIYGGYLKTYPELKALDLESTLAKATILSSSSPLFVEKNSIKQECTAVNFSRQLTVIVNERRWNKIADGAVKEALALHELLGLVGIEGTGNYYISKNYLIKNGFNCAEGLCEDSNPLPGKVEDFFCRLNNQMYPNPKTYNYPFDCAGGKKDFRIYCNLWLDPVEFGHNKIDIQGGVFEKKDKAGGILSFSDRSKGSMRCTFEDE